MDRGLIPRAIPVRREFKHDARFPLEGIPRCAVEVSCGIKHQAGKGDSSVRDAERMKHVLPPPVAFRRQLEHCTVVVSTTVHRRAVEVSCRIENKATVGVGSVRDAKRVEHALPPSSTPARRQLEHRAITVSAAIDCRSVKVSDRVENKARRWGLPICDLERIEYL